MSYCIAREMRGLHSFADDQVRRVNAIAPGAVDTARFKDECKDDPQQFWKEAQATVCHSCSNLTVLFRVFYILKRMLITSGLKDCSSQTRALRIGGKEYLVSCKREF